MTTNYKNTEEIKKSFFFGNINSVFVTRTAAELSNRGIPIEIFDIYQIHPSPDNFGKLNKIWITIKRIITTIKFLIKIKSVESATIHSVSINIFWLTPLLKLKFKKIICIAYGSDILRRNKNRDFFLRFGFLFIDSFMATNINVIDQLKKDFPYLKNKIGILRFGLSVFDEIDNLDKMAISAQDARYQLGLDPKKDVICLGYSADPGQRQIELIKYFINYPATQFQFVIPIQYGNTNTIHEIQKFCREIENNNSFILLTEFYDTRKSALLRKATSILINHSISDSFSGTVQETIYAGGKVLANQCLPYENMPGFQSAIKKFNSLEDIDILLSNDMLLKWENTKNHAHKENIHALRNISGWDSVIEDWKHTITV